MPPPADPLSAPDDDATAAEQLLRQVARAADGIAGGLQRAHATPDSDLAVWLQAEREILGEPSDRLAARASR